MKQKTFSAILFAAVVFMFAAFNVNAQQKDFAVGATLDNFTLPDTNGATQNFDKLKGKQGAVLIFLSAQCPVVKGYGERIVKIADDLKAKGINVIGINSNATESLDFVKSNAAERNYNFPILIDKNNVIADKLGANVTPEVFYFSDKGILLYHGAIDNDRSGKNITINYLSDAADAAASGKSIATTKANAFGCSIKRAAN